MTTTNIPQYEAAGLEYIQWKRKDNHPVMLEYSVFKRMLPRVLNDEGLLTGQRVLDLACGEGYFTRRLKALNCAFIRGVDLSSTMIDVARNIDAQDSNEIEYVVMNVKDLPLPEQPFDLVVGFFLLNYARTKEELFIMVRNIFLQLGEHKCFIGITSNVLTPKMTFNRNAYRKYGFTVAAEISSGNARIPDGTECDFTVYDDRDEILASFKNYYLSPETYEEVFKEAGFTTFEWVPFQHDSNMPNSDFYEDYFRHPHAVGIIAMK